MDYQTKKTVQPLLPAKILFRGDLVRQLEQSLILPLHQQGATCKLVLLRTPAGYGKTTLLADFARRIERPVSWYFLDREDADLLLFLKTLTALFCRAFPGIEQVLPLSFLHDLTTAIESGNTQQTKRGLSTYTAVLEELFSQPLILCLCNYQEINESPSVQIVMNYLLKRMPSNLSIVIESRAIPLLDLTPLLAKRQILGLGTNALRFSAKEIQEFSRLQQDTPITEEIANQLAKNFDGWIASILLMTSLGNRSDSYTTNFSDGSWNSPALSMGKHTLLSYLKNDVFTQAERAFDFLQETSLLNNLVTTHCNYLLQVEDAEAVLSVIERQGLFLSRVESQETAPTYVLHPVVQKLLYNDLCQTQSERASLLHCRAATLFHSLGDDEQALTHAATAKEYGMIRDILLEVITCGRDERIPQAHLAHWIDILPVSIREHHPRLLQARALIHLAQYEHLKALPLLEQAYQFVKQRAVSIIDGESASTLLAVIAIARSSISFYEGQYIQTQQLCLEALELVSANEIKLRIQALLRLGICKTFVGEYTDGITSLQQALQLSGHATINLQTAYLHSSLGNSYTLICNYALAEHHRARAILIYEQLHHIQGKIQNLIWLAILKRNKGEFREAESMLQDILIKARQEYFQSGEAYALFNLGANYADTDTLSEALIALEDSLSLARHIGDKRLTDQCLCVLSIVHLLMGDINVAKLLLAQTTVAQTKEEGYESLFYNLVLSTAFLYQQNIEQAMTGFQALEQRAQETRLRRVQIECLIRLAVCYYKLNRLTEMREPMEKVVQLVSQGYFEHVPLIEFRRFPEVWKIVQTFPESACLSNWRSVPNTEEEDDPAHTEIFSVQTLDLPAHSSKTKLQIQAFGEPTVIIDEIPITRWNMALAMEMYFFLLDYHRPIHKEHLVNVFWPEEKEYIDQTFRSALHYLRKIIGGSCITSHGGIYTLDLSARYGDDIWYDVSLFQDHYAKAQEALITEQREQTEAHFQAMIDLYHGDYLQSFYSNWCIPRRNELRRYYLNARRELARIAWDSQQIEQSLSHWQHILALDDCSEEAHYGVMRCYARLGKRSLALRQYQHCAETLKREFATSPGPALRKFHQRLIEGYSASTN